MRVAVLAVTSPGGNLGGAHRFYLGLERALNAVPGIDAERVELPSDERTFDSVLEAYLRAYDLDLSRFDAVISTKAPGYAVRHPNHVCYLLHTMRVFYDMFDAESGAAPEQRQRRALIQQLDTAALQFPRTRAVYAIGHEVRRRLLEHNGVDCEVLHPALALEGLRPGAYEHALLPGRLHRWKRVDLVIRAMRLVQRPLKLLIAGTGEDEEGLRALAAGDERIRFLGAVSDRELVDLYASALVVPFPPVREDFGLVAIEALASGKPVITCRDSGEPALLVRDGETGFVCEPSPEAIAEKLEHLYDRPDLARAMGQAGPPSIRGIRWEHVAASLVEAICA
ncbi:MAG TPA: glycosyltransferase family 4 protein [Myxococcales bacterium]|nr:glycosyltransferase family 4 protein [Myxococcales bacterium]